MKTAGPSRRDGSPLGEADLGADLNTPSLDADSTHHHAIALHSPCVGHAWLCHFRRGSLAAVSAIPTRSAR
jgi:hypothetical protein